MKSQKIFLFKVVLVSFILLNFSLAQAKRKKVAIKSNDSIATILKKYEIQPSHLSLEIKNDDEDVFSLNAFEKKVPASVSKVMTSYAVLARFPLGFHFVTQVYSDQKNLYFKGGGDPSFVSENMWYLVNELTRQNLKVIQGDIIVDDSLFDKVRFDDSREDKRVDRAYDSPVGAMSFNWNAVNVFIKPTKVGEKAQVVVDPENDLFELRNHTTTVSGNPKKDLVVSISNTEKLISVSGEVSAKAPEKAIFKSISDPEIWAGINLKAFLKQRGIQVLGKVKAGPVSEKAELLTSVESKNLSVILSDMNKFSNNFVAEMLTKNLPSKEIKSNISLKQGVDVIRNELNKIGLTAKDFEIENPSGFTRNNKLTANALNKILITIKNNFTMFPTFIDSLPIAGIDGTLKKRMKDTEAQGFVRAKTGYLNGVVSLAGYAGRKDGSVLTFSFLYNGPRDETIVREAFDQVLLSVLK
jgi:D-alanyl-D-alanine carboxypeptidase/D-alanyl-D-alanine-endopeptidase (penicillin-binding protein 4)